jgi:hypothetical protein
MKNMMNGKCKCKSSGLMMFQTLEAKCTLKFSYNTQFEFKYLENGKVELIRKDMWIEISKEEFKNKFKVIEEYNYD